MAECYKKRKDRPKTPNLDHINTFEEASEALKRWKHDIYMKKDFTDIEWNIIEECACLVNPKEIVRKYDIKLKKLHDLMKSAGVMFPSKKDYCNSDIENFEQELSVDDKMAIIKENSVSYTYTCIRSLVQRYQTSREKIVSLVIASKRFPEKYNIEKFCNSDMTTIPKNNSLLVKDGPCINETHIDFEKILSSDPETEVMPYIENLAHHYKKSIDAV